MKIGVTGANGFVGHHVVQRLTSASHDVTSLVRKHTSPAHASTVIPSLNAHVDIDALAASLTGLDVLVHIAAHVHAMRGDPDDPKFHDVNVVGSTRLFEAAVKSGIKKFIFISSVKAAGERSADIPLSLTHSPGPEDAYGRSKLDAEHALGAMSLASGCSLVILRPTFIYGWPPVGNFKAVMRAVSKGIPLPLAAIRNRRHMVFVGNLADAIREACETNDLSSEPYFIANTEPVSTPDLFRMTGEALSSPARLFPLPVWILRLAGQLTGRRDMIARITENLEVDITPFCRDADWIPPYNMTEGLKSCAVAYRDAEKDKV
jgi:nucleoside-diphosphate-sugar epimerase